MKCLDMRIPIRLFASLKGICIPETRTRQLKLEMRIYLSK
jgi:hypothetical protein